LPVKVIGRVKGREKRSKETSPSCLSASSCGSSGSGLGGSGLGGSGLGGSGLGGSGLGGSGLGGSGLGGSGLGGSLGGFWFGRDRERDAEGFGDDDARGAVVEVADVAGVGAVADAAAAEAGVLVEDDGEALGDAQGAEGLVGDAELGDVVAADGEELLLAGVVGVGEQGDALDRLGGGLLDLHAGGLVVEAAEGGGVGGEDQLAAGEAGLVVERDAQALGDLDRADRAPELQGGGVVGALAEALLATAEVVALVEGDAGEGGPALDDDARGAVVEGGDAGGVGGEGERGAGRVGVGEQGDPPAGRDLERADRVLADRQGGEVVVADAESELRAGEVGVGVEGDALGDAHRGLHADLDARGLLVEAADVAGVGAEGDLAPAEIGVLVEDRLHAGRDLERAQLVVADEQLLGVVATDGEDLAAPAEIDLLEDDDFTTHARNPLCVPGATLTKRRS
jgi:hypothetical protein